MKLFSLLLGAALVSGASAAACATCKAATGDLAKPLTCTSATVALTCSPGSVLGGATATPDCIICSDDTLSCEKGAANAVTSSATISLTCSPGFFLQTNAGVDTCLSCGNNVASCKSPNTAVDFAAAATAGKADKVCKAGFVGNAAAGSIVTCGACHATCGTEGCTLTNDATKCKGCTGKPSFPAGGTAANGDGEKSCPACHVSCTTCAAVTAANKCITCNPGYIPMSTAAGAACVACNNWDVADAAKLALTCSAAGATLKDTKCKPGAFLSAAGTCTTCTAGACATHASMPEKFADKFKACPLGTESADLGLAANNCGTCQGGATCTAATAVAPAAALTCAAKFQKRDIGEAAGAKCLPGAFGVNVAECVADCANVAGKTKNVAQCACGKDVFCSAGDGCTAADLTKAGVCAVIKAQPAKKAPASTLQASALLSAAALLVAMRQ